jgi:hypothetical protein
MVADFQSGARAAIEAAPQSHPAAYIRIMA